MSAPVPYRRPAAAPSPHSEREQRRFQELISGSLPGVRASAERWRVGLAGLVALVTTGLLVKGPESAARIAWPGRLALTVLIAAGIATAVIGLWQATRASAGEPGRFRLAEIRDEYGGLTGYEAMLAATAADQLDAARRALTIALPLLAAAVLLWWWVPQEHQEPVVRVTVAGTATVCGVLLGADQQALRIRVGGEPAPRLIAFATVTDLRSVPAC